MPSVTIHQTPQLWYNPDLGGWQANCVIICSNGDTHSGLEFVALPETNPETGMQTSEDEIKLALLRLYDPTGEL